MEKIIIIGAGGHSKVILDIINAQKAIMERAIEVIGFLDDDQSKKELNGIPVIGVIDDIINYTEKYDGIKFINGIGNNLLRKSIAERYKNIKYYTAIHPQAIISRNANIGEGTVIMPGAIINSNAIIGRHAIINSGAIIEHDNIIEDYVHVSPGVKCAGNVKVGECSHIGIGATIIPSIVIGRNTNVGAGAVVIKELPSYCTAVGVPAKIIKYHDRGGC